MRVLNTFYQYMIEKKRQMEVFKERKNVINELSKEHP